MEEIIICNKKMDAQYPVYVGSSILAKVKDIPVVKAASSLVIVTDTVVAKLWLESLKKELTPQKICVIRIQPGEKNKTLSTLSIIWEKMLKNNVDRSSVIVTLGGGVVCDMGGFAAGTFMRGIPVIHIPTTLLAQVDAGVGGKTAIDFCGAKNNIGVFHQPHAVIIDVQMLQTLPQRQIVSGFAEVIKHAIIADTKLFEKLIKINIETISNKEWVNIITQSIKVKKRIVELDEMEKNGMRKLLNFGHTIGHAIESLSLKTESPLLHGEAVSIGMVAETKMSRLAGLISVQEEENIVSLILKYNLPTFITGISPSDILSMMCVDKKNKKGKILWVLPTKIGNAKSDIFLSKEIIKKGILAIIS